MTHFYLFIIFSRFFPNLSLVSGALKEHFEEFGNGNEWVKRKTQKHHKASHKMMLYFKPFETVQKLCVTKNCIY